jgi:hypothetical protein
MNSLALENGSKERSARIFWFTPEGCFEAAEQKNGLFVERVLLRTELGFCEIGPRQGRSIVAGSSGEKPERPASN